MHPWSSDLHLKSPTPDPTTCAYCDRPALFKWSFKGVCRTHKNGLDPLLRLSNRRSDLKVESKDEEHSTVLGYIDTRRMNWRKRHQKA